MSGEIKQRRRVRGEATRTAIIEAAEMLFAEHGVNGASLRQIGVASGSANTNVVAYHFGDRDALVAAVIQHRLPAIEAFRTSLLEQWEQRGTPLTLLELLFIIYRPIHQQRNSEGRRSYAAFLGGLLRSGEVWRKFSVDDRYPTTARVIAMIHDQVGLNNDLFRARMRVCTSMVAASLDPHAHKGLLPEEAEDRQLLDVLLMAEAALRARAEPPASLTAFAQAAC